MTNPTATHQVLYVEDNAANVSLMQRLIKRRPSIELVVATDGAQGLELAVAIAPCLILLDGNLPDISGEDFTRTLRRELGDEATPIVVLSADALESRIEGFLALGIEEYITKPFDVQRLLRLLDAHCQSC